MTDMEENETTLSIPRPPKLQIPPDDPEDYKPSFCDFLREETSITTKARLFFLLAILLVFIVLVLIAFLFCVIAYPFLLPLGGMAILFGMRHAVDADHIAAIDNVTRKFVAEGKKPFAIGFFFSIGHSTMVILMSSLVILLSQTVLKKKIQNVGAIVGTSISACFLFLIAIVNLVVFIGLVRTWRKITSKDREYGVTTVEDILKTGGMMTRCFPCMFKLIDSSWKMYFLGLLFSLGFDTSSEIAILGISALTASKDVPPFVVLILPALFTGAMALLDTLDGIFMVYAYGWSNVSPLKKLFYNMSVTFFSIAIAFVVGTIEILQVLQEEFNLSGPFWRFISSLNLEILGIVIIGLFVLSFAISSLLYYTKYQKMDLDLEDEHISSLETPLIQKMDLDLKDGHLGIETDLIQNV